AVRLLRRPRRGPDRSPAAGAEGRGEVRPDRPLVRGPSTEVHAYRWCVAPPRRGGLAPAIPVPVAERTTMVDVERIRRTSGSLRLAAARARRGITLGTSATVRVTADAARPAALGR